jgi:hypothetical protein
MGCTEVKSRKYQTRKSPPVHAGDCKGETKTGKDGEYLSKPDARGVYKWIKTRKAGKPAKNTKKTKNTNEYIIWDNFTAPFKVKVNGNRVAIYKTPTFTGLHEIESTDYTVLVKELTVSGVYPGTDPRDPIICPEQKDCESQWFAGETVLLHLSGNRYMFIGRFIYEFTIDDEFEAFYSFMDKNGGQPIVALLGSKYVYLVHTSIQKYIPRELFKGSMTPAEWADAESYYYGHKNFKTGEKWDYSERGHGHFRRDKKLFHKIKNIKVIKV